MQILYVIMGLLILRGLASKDGEEPTGPSVSKPEPKGPELESFRRSPVEAVREAAKPTGVPVKSSMPSGQRTASEAVREAVSAAPPKVTEEEIVETTLEKERRIAESNRSVLEREDVPEHIRRIAEEKPEGSKRVSDVLDRERRNLIRFVERSIPSLEARIRTRYAGMKRQGLEQRVIEAQLRGPSRTLATRRIQLKALRAGMPLVEYKNKTWRAGDAQRVAAFKGAIAGA